MKNKSPFPAFLEQPYPYYYEGKKLVQIMGMIFSIALLFNYLLQPFDVNVSEQKMDYFWVCFIHSVNPLLVLLCLSFLYNLFPKITDHWKIRKEVVFILLLVVFTGISQFLIREIIYKNPLNWSWHYFREEVLNAFIAGLFLGPIVILINGNRQQAKNQLKASHISELLADTKETHPNTTLLIETEVKSEKFTFDSNTFVYAKAEGNYTDIYLKKEQGVQKLTKRISLKNLEAQLQQFPYIIKTHRSILINKDYIENVSGNAQGYKVTLQDCPDTIPVSRNYIQSFDSETASR
ncbi:LytR/AlgR family response regulator transcription factor [Flavobacterium humi]|uniref:LytTR family transcriptional regulator n=1 Tax=Flavobacterium humi TaxID=2562683 RepID=A0A4Z0L3A7_9FLAO|nr:LytTR family DNA-binding domain-containing protein [Flavobacterium humi]TGD56718.1 LytTR family transcriptional regulator [Flavobacterium humi]